MRPPSTIGSSLSVHRAFVVQFRAETNAGNEHFVGRIEHVASQEVCRFQSWLEMQTFVEDMLEQVQTELPEAP